MHIIHVNHRYFPALGGSETHFRQISERLVKKGHRVSVITSDLIDLSGDVKHKPFVENINGVEVFRIFFSKSLKLRVTNRIRKVAKKLNSAILWSIFRDPLGIFIISKVINIKDAEIINAGAMPSSCIGGALLASKVLKIPSVATPFYPVGNQGIVQYNKLWTDVLNMFDNVITPTKAERNYLSKQGVDVKKVQVIGTGVECICNHDLPRLQEIQQKKNFKVLYLCTRILEEGKGIRMVMEAAKRLKDVEFSFGGDSFENWNMLKKKIPAAPNCKYLGILTEKEKMRELGKADLFVMPSVVESFGICYMEALAAGKPIIVADSPVTKELYKDVAEFVEYGNVENLIKSIRKLKFNTEIYNQYSKKGRILASNYAWSKIVTKIELLYSSLIRKEKS